MSHAFYVFGAWGVTVATIVAVVAHTWYDNIRLQGEIRKLEQRGIRRRSDESRGPAP